MKYIDNNLDGHSEKCFLVFVVAFLRVLDIIALAFDELLDGRPGEDVAQVAVVVLGRERL